jgi:hypothetical protein
LLKNALEIGQFFTWYAVFSKIKIVVGIGQIIMTDPSDTLLFPSLYWTDVRLNSKLYPIKPSTITAITNTKNKMTITDVMLISITLYYYIPLYIIAGRI